MHHDRPLSAIVSRFTVRLAHSLQDGDDRLMQHDRLLSAIVSLSRSDRPIPSRMATNVLCSAIVPSAPSYLASPFGLPHSIQDGDERLMQHDRLLSAIVSLSRSDRPIPSRMATNVLCSAIGPSAPSYLASRFGSTIPSRMATTVLCSTIGFSAPSCLFHVRIAPFPSGWRRPSYVARSASQRHRVSFMFGSPHSLQDGDERLMQCDRPLSAIVPGFTVRLAHSLQDGNDRLM
ncbi:unnamed protein product [Cuscuta epithymum]|uniref:Uncharacterized protein n=1 Tax=Cuscuta epithymum TaxID=186058 RepID=A0AAV0CHW1_9ASTE|nr:unnamed protein product [Cuscuta epithymum]